MATVKSKNILWHGGTVSAADRARLLGQSGCVVWLTGLSGSGKSTLARALETHLVSKGRACYVLDGDNIRQGLNRDLGFSPSDRHENIRRIGEVAALLADAGLITITAFISPYRADRRLARQAAGVQPFMEVFLNTSLAVCRRRDPKGLYARARQGQVKQFTGVAAPYERPRRPDMVLDTGKLDVAHCIKLILGCLKAAGVFRTTPRPRRRKGHKWPPTT